MLHWGKGKDGHKFSDARIDVGPDSFPMPSDERIPCPLAAGYDDEKSVPLSFTNPYYSSYLVRLLGLTLTLDSGDSRLLYKTQ